MKQNQDLFKDKDDITQKNISLLWDIIVKNISDDLWEDKPPTDWLGKIIRKGEEGKASSHTVSIRMGYAMEAIFYDLLKLKFGVSYVQRVIAGHGVKEEEVPLYEAKLHANELEVKKSKNFVILTRLNPVEFARELASEVEQFVQLKKFVKKSDFPEYDCRLGQAELNKISERILDKVSLTSEVDAISVDMVVSPNDEDSSYKVVELKLTFDVDYKKTKSVLTEDMLKPFVSLGDKSKELFAGIVSNSKKFKANGDPKLIISNYLLREAVLVDEEVYNIFAPEGVGFDIFKSLIEKRIDSVR